MSSYLLFSTGKSGFRLAAQFGFIVLFPGYVIYHYGVAEGWVPAVFGGLFGLASFLFFFPGAAYFVVNLVNFPTRLPSLEFVFLFLILYLSTWSFGAVIILSDYHHIMPAFFESLATIIIWVSAYFIGANLPLQKGIFYWLMLFLLLTIICIFFHSIQRYGYLEGPYLTFSGLAESGAVTTYRGLTENYAIASYQGIGRSVLALIVVIGCLQTRFAVQIMFLTAAIPLLFLVGSRAHFFALLALFTVLLLRYGLKGRLFFVTSAAIIIAFFAFYVGADLFLDSRFGEIFNISLSASWQARTEASWGAMEVIFANPIVGSFGYHLGSADGYAHNLISAWTEYGLVGFLLFVGLMIYALGISLRHILLGSLNLPLWQIAFQFNLIAFFLALFSEPVMSSVFPALGWGFTVQAIRATKRTASKSFFQAVPETA